MNAVVALGQVNVTDHTSPGSVWSRTDKGA
jgi:hypothetical protein